MNYQGTEIELLGEALQRESAGSVGGHLSDREYHSRVYEWLHDYKQILEAFGKGYMLVPGDDALKRQEEEQKKLLNDIKKIVGAGKEEKPEESEENAKGSYENNGKDFFLRNPHAGWTTVAIGNKVRSASYLTDVPIDCLEAMVYALDEGRDFCVTFDGEGEGEFKVLSDAYRTYLIEEKDQIELYSVDRLSKYQIASMLLHDITGYLDGWVRWLSYEDDSEKKLEERKCHIRNLLTHVERLLEARQRS